MPVGAERLEERELRLDRDGVRRDRVDDPAAEARDVAAQLDRQQVGPRIEPDDELAALALDLGGEPVAERERRDSHRGQLRRRPERRPERPHVPARRTSESRMRRPSSKRLRQRSVSGVSRSSAPPSAGCRR